MSREFVKSRKAQLKQATISEAEAQSFIDRYTFAEARSRPHLQIGGRNDYMRYRNAQFALDKFDFRNPLILEAIVLSYAYEKRRGFSKLSPRTDATMKTWIAEWISFIRNNAEEEFLAWVYDNNNPKTLAQIERELKRWGDLSRYEKVSLFESARHGMHEDGYILTYIYGWTREGADYFMDELSELLKEKN